MTAPFELGLPYPHNLLYLRPHFAYVCYGHIVTATLGK